MSLRRLCLAFILTLVAFPARAQGGDVWEAWTSIFADFFLGPETREEFRWRGPVSPGGTVEIKGVNGSIRAEPAAGNDVEIVALKRGRRSAPREVQVKVVPHDGGLTVCAVYPTSGFAPANECQPGAGGRMNVRNNDVSVDFTVRVPAGSGLVARTVNGGVQASGLRGRVEAHTVNGSVRLTTDGAAEVETVNGSIDAALGRTDWKDAASFQTVNGSITLALPREASTAVEARTVNGRIAVDFELAGARTTRRELSGTIGAGGRKLALATVNGGIRVRREN
jgi:Putative adhesin